MTSFQTPGRETVPIGLEGPKNFRSTQWSVVLRAGGLNVQQEDQQQALASLLKTYWYPIYAFARRKGVDRETAQDQVQAFFTGLLESGDLEIADEQRGRFRTFLLSCFVNFLKNQWKAERALKRGGGVLHFSMDHASAELRYSMEPVTSRDAEAIYMESWARTLMERVVERLHEEYEQTGKKSLFGELRGLLGGDSTCRPYVDIALSLGVSEGAVKVAVHRLRKRFGEILRVEISSTLSAPEQFDDELQGLLEALG